MDIKCLTEKGINLRTALRGMKCGKSLLIECRNGYDLHSKRTNVYQLAAAEGRKYKCVMGEGWRLLVTRIM